MILRWTLIESYIMIINELEKYDMDIGIKMHGIAK